MKTKVVKIENTNLYILKNDNFKTTRIEAKFRINIDKKEVPILGLLSNALTYTTKNYNTKKELTNRCKDLYDLIPSCNVIEEGNRHTLNLALSFLNDKYSEENLLEEAVNLTHEIIYNPNITDNKYDEETFNAVLTIEKAYLETLKEDKVKYSSKRLMDILNEDDEDYLSILSKEYYDIVANSTREDLAKCYNDVINNSELSILIIGDVDIDKTEELFKKYFKEKHGIKYDKDANKYYKINKKVETVFESDKSSQSKLNIAFNLPENMTNDNKLIELQILNIILGGFANSLFFKNIREKHSLCYYVSTYTPFYDNLLVVRSGISKENYDKMIKLIKKEIKRVIDKDYSDSLLEEAKKHYISCLKSNMDYPAAILNNYYTNKVDGLSLFENRYDAINKVTKDDIKELASKLKMNTIYMFGGDSKND